MMRSHNLLSKRRLFGCAAGIVAFGLMTLTSQAENDAVRTAMSHDGLQEVKSGNLDMLYIQPGATLAAYRKVWLDPIEVAFHESWNPDRRKVDAEDRERIRKELAAAFQDVFAEELQQKGGYEIVSAARPDVLRVSAAIINLYISAPDAMEVGRSRTYTVSPGEMTLVAELRDAETGATVARVADRRSGSSVGMMQWTTHASNVSDARRVLRTWAGILRKGLDPARDAGT